MQRRRAKRNTGASQDSCWLLVAPGQFPEKIVSAEKTIALTGVYVWDGESGERSREPWTLRIRGKKIEAMGPEADLAAGARAIPLSGSTAIPGLIDAHVHLCLDPAIGPPEEQDAVPEPERMRAMEARAEAMLKSGITTARDLGGGKGFELELRDRIARGECAGPRLLCGGPTRNDARWALPLLGW